MRTLRVIVAAAFILSLMAIPSGAEAPSRVDEHRVSLFCEQLSNEAGGSGRMGVFVSQLLGSGVGLEYWAPGTSMETDPLTYRNYESEDAPPQTITLDGLTLDADIPLVDQNFEPTGLSAQIINAVLTPTGDPVVIDDRGGGGNEFIHFTATFQQATASGTLQMPDGQSFDLSSCTGEIEDSSRFETNPNSLVNSFRGLSMSCSLETTDGLVELNIVNQQRQTFADVYFSPSSAGHSLVGFAEGVTFDSHVADAQIPVFDESSDPAGEATVEATFTVRETIQFDVKRSNSRERIKATLFDTVGTLALPGGIDFDLAPCHTIKIESRLIETSSNGPKPGGATPRNDTPEKATLMTPGSKVTTRTGGAAHDPEVPCLLPTEPDPVPADFAYTVWYAIEGTGGEVTVDTAGSDYDTIMGVYTTSGGDFIQEQCVDDVPVEPLGNTLQSRTTISTTFGVTYLVQIGGPQFDDWPQFGLLKVAVTG